MHFSSSPHLNLIIFVKSIVNSTLTCPLCFVWIMASTSAEHLASHVFLPFSSVIVPVIVPGIIAWSFSVPWIMASTSAEHLASPFFLPFSSVIVPVIVPVIVAWSSSNWNASRLLSVTEQATAVRCSSIPSLQMQSVGFCPLQMQNIAIIVNIPQLLPSTCWGKSFPVLTSCHEFFSLVLQCLKAVFACCNRCSFNCFLLSLSVACQASFVARQARQQPSKAHPHSLSSSSDGL